MLIFGDKNIRYSDFESKYSGYLNVEVFLVLCDMHSSILSKAFSFTGRFKQLSGV